MTVVTKLRKSCVTPASCLLALAALILLAGPSAAAQSAAAEAGQPALSDKLLLLAVGALGGVLSTMAAAAFNDFLKRRSAREAERAQIRRSMLDPLRVAAAELAKQLAHVDHELDTKRRLADGRVQAEREIAERDLVRSYTLRWWFWWCKELIVSPNSNWTDAQRLSEFAMHSGGEGYDAASTLYITGYYLHFATSLRTSLPYVRIRGEDEGLLRRIDNVRDAFAVLEFYKIAQDSTGDTFRDAQGRPISYRDLASRISDTSTRGWLLTLADFYYKLYRQPRKPIAALIEALNDLEMFLVSKVKLGTATRPSSAG